MEKLLFVVEVSSSFDEYSATTFEDDSEHDSPYTALDRKDELNSQFDKDGKDHLYASVIVKRK